LAAKSEIGGGKIVRFSASSLRLLRLAVQGNYCSWPAMDSDPFFASVRAMPDFAAIRAAGMACQQNFLAARQHMQQEAHQ